MRNQVESREFRSCRLIVTRCTTGYLYHVCVNCQLTTVNCVLRLWYSQVQRYYLTVKGTSRSTTYLYWSSRRDPRIKYLHTFFTVVLELCCGVAYAYELNCYAEGIVIYVMASSHRGKWPIGTRHTPSMGCGQHKYAYEHMAYAGIIAPALLPTMHTRTPHTLIVFFPQSWKFVHRVGSPTNLNIRVSTVVGIDQFSTAPILQRHDVSTSITDQRIWDVRSWYVWESWKTKSLIRTLDATHWLDMYHRE